jgi:hypothetical protein
MGVISSFAQKKRDYVRSIAVLAALTGGLMQLWKKKKVIKKVRRGNRRRDRSLVLQETENLPDYIFKSMFRMNRECFEMLLDKLSTYLPPDATVEQARKQVKGSKGEPLSNRIKLLATLRYLAGGSHWDI